MTMSRLDAVLAHAGLGSRRAVRDLVRSGRVTVNREVTSDPAHRLDPTVAAIAVDGKAIAPPGHRHLVMHKPVGVITATFDRSKPTVMDLVPSALRHRDLRPVGRLDKDTSGILLLTTDGELAHRLLSPRRHVEKTYRVTLDHRLQPSAIAELAKGVLLAGGTACLPAGVASGPGETEVFLSLFEGKYHQVRRMMAAVGASVLALERVQFGPLALTAGWPPRTVRLLAVEEVAALYAAAASDGLHDRTPYATLEQDQRPPMED